MIRGNGTGGYRQRLPLCERYKAWKCPLLVELCADAARFLFDTHHHRLITFSAICIDEQPF
jgi:hypothetical protein